MSEEPCLRDPKEGPYERKAVIGGNRRHRCKSIEAASPAQAHEKGFGLVVFGMCGDKAGETVRPAMPRHQSVAGAAGRRLYSRFGFDTAPSQRRVGEPEFGRLLRHEGGFLLAFRPQSV